MDTNVADLVRNAASADPEGVGLRDPASGRVVTWANLDELVDRAAAGFVSLGLVAGYRVLLAAGNSIEFAASYLGALRAGLVVVPVNPRSTTREFATLIIDSGPRVILADGQTVDRIRKAVAGLDEANAHGQGPDVDPKVVVLDGVAVGDEHSWSTLIAAEQAPAPPPRDAEALAVLLYTSGTSGNPRGAMLTHRALLANISQVANNDGSMIGPDDVVLGLLPLFHVYGLNAVLGQVVNQQAELVLANGFDPVGTLDLIEAEQITVLPLAPVVIAHWMSEVTADIDLAAKLASVRLVLCGSAPLAPELSRAFTERTGLVVHQGYGLTEAAPVVSLTLGSEHPPSGTVGALVPGVQVRLVDESGSAPESEDAGEIMIKGDNLFSGYWPDGADGPDEDGWWPTGDMGFLDSSGALFLVDRVKELVIVSGFNVYPMEVEDILEELPEVDSAAVIGVEDELTGEAVVAYLKPAAGSAPEAVKDAAVRHVEARLARYKRPTHWHVVADLPFTATGKVRKGMLRATERRRALGLLD
ncbi:MAG: class I adenylate-forming enzyme family protein [Nocardioidaceae bacterium]